VQVNERSYIPINCWYELVEQGLTSHSTQFRSFWIQCFYRSDDPTNTVKALKVSYPDSSQSHQAHLTILQ